MASQIKSRSEHITIGDVARELGLSKTTISRAISGKGRISEETRKRVNEYIKEHNYKPNVIAKGLAQSKTYNIGVMLPADSNLSELPFFHGCLIGISETAAGCDYDVIVTTSTEKDITFLKRLIDNHKVDGIILTRTLQEDDAVQYLKENEIPFVVIGSVADPDVIQIDSDHVSCCCELTSYLQVKGCQRIALLCGNRDHIVNNMRCRGFMMAAGKTGTKQTPERIYAGLNSKSMIQRALDLALDDNADCILCSDDNICSTVLAKLNGDGYQIPGDIKVASFYNSSYLANYNPPITAINIDVKELGAFAGKRLIELLKNGKTIEKTMVPYEVLIKKSTM